MNKIKNILLSIICASALFTSFVNAADNRGYVYPLTVTQNSTNNSVKLQMYFKGNTRSVEVATYIHNKWYNEVISVPSNLFYKKGTVTIRHKSRKDIYQQHKSGVGKIHVRYKDSQGKYGRWSVSARLTINPKPVTKTVNTRPTLVSPLGKVTTATPTYKWRKVNGATRYFLHVRDSKGKTQYKWYSSSTLRCYTGTCSVKASKPVATGKFSWKVRPYGSLGTSSKYGDFSSTATPYLGGLKPSKSQPTKDASGYYYIPGLVRASYRNGKYVENEKDAYNNGRRASQFITDMLKTRSVIKIRFPKGYYFISYRIGVFKRTGDYRIYIKIPSGTTIATTGRRTTGPFSPFIVGLGGDLSKGRVYFLAGDNWNSNNKVMGGTIDTSRTHQWRPSDIDHSSNCAITSHGVNTLVVHGLKFKGSSYRSDSFIDGVAKNALIRHNTFDTNIEAVIYMNGHLYNNSQKVSNATIQDNTFINVGVPVCKRGIPSCDIFNNRYINSAGIAGCVGAGGAAKNLGSCRGMRIRGNHAYHNSKSRFKPGSLTFAIILDDEYGNTAYDVQNNTISGWKYLARITGTKKEYRNRSVFRNNTLSKLCYKDVKTQSTCSAK